MSKKQILILASLLSMPLLIYVIWGLLNLNIEGGPVVNFGLFQLSNGLSDILAWLLGIILPIILVIALMAVSRKWKWGIRVILPIVIGIAVIALNIIIGGSILRHKLQYRHDFSCTTIEFHGKLTEACPNVD